MFLLFSETVRLFPGFSVFSSKGMAVGRSTRVNVNDKNQIYSGDCTHFAADIPNVPHSSVYIWILLL